MGTLDGKRIAFLATDGVEQVELTEPLKAVRDAGAEVDLISLEKGEFQGFNHLDKGDTFTADKAVADADADDYDGLVQPGGVANPDFLRMDPDAMAFVRAFFEAKKPVGVICHAPVDPRRGRRRQRPHGDLVALAAEGPAQRGRQLGRRGGRRRRGPRDQPQPRRPAGLLRQDRRGVRGGPPPGRAPARGQRAAPSQAQFPRAPGGIAGRMGDT